MLILVWSADMVSNQEGHPYVAAAIDGEVARLASAAEGERNDTLFKCSDLPQTRNQAGGNGYQVHVA